MTTDARTDRDSTGDAVTDPSAIPASPNASKGMLGGSFTHLYAGKGDAVSASHLPVVCCWTTLLMGLRCG